MLTFYYITIVCVHWIVIVLYGIYQLPFLYLGEIFYASVAGILAVCYVLSYKTLGTEEYVTQYKQSILRFYPIPYMINCCLLFVTSQFIICTVWLCILVIRSLIEQMIYDQYRRG